MKWRTSIVLLTMIVMTMFATAQALATDGVEYFVGVGAFGPQDKDSAIDVGRQVYFSPRLDLVTHDWQIALNFTFTDIELERGFGEDEPMYSGGLSLIHNIDIGDAWTLAPEVGFDYNILEGDGVDDRFTYKGMVSLKTPINDTLEFVVGAGYQFDCENDFPRLAEGYFGQIGLIFKTN